MTIADAPQQPTLRARGKRRPPVLYSPELATTLIEKLCSGLSLRKIARQPGMPNEATICHWVARKPEFRKVYVEALEARGCQQVERILALVDEVEAIGKRVGDGELDPAKARVMIDAKRVQIDTRKWNAARMAPKIYGDRVALTGHDGGAVKHQHDLSHLSDEQLDTLEQLIGSTAASSGDPCGEDTTHH